MPTCILQLILVFNSKNEWTSQICFTFQQMQDNLGQKQQNEKQ